MSSALSESMAIASSHPSSPQMSVCNLSDPETSCAHMQDIQDHQTKTHTPWLQLLQAQWGAVKLNVLTSCKLR